MFDFESILAPFITLFESLFGGIFQPLLDLISGLFHGS